MAKGTTIEFSMNGVVLNADHKENLLYVATLLFENNANAIVIRTGGVPVGIVTAKDIVKALLSSKSPEILTAREFMSSPIIGVAHDEDLHEVRKTMLKNNVTKLPVVKEDDIIGLVVQHDLIKDISWISR